MGYLKTAFGVVLLATSAYGNAQYDPNCDCSFQGGEKRDYQACNADLDIKPINRSSSAITDYIIDAKVDTKQCSIVYYDVLSENGSQNRKQINVVDGSNSEILSGETYSATPDIKIRDCVICRDERISSELSIEHSKFDSIRNEMLLIAERRKDRYASIVEQRKRETSILINKLKNRAEGVNAQDLMDESDRIEAERSKKNRAINDEESSVMSDLVGQLESKGLPRDQIMGFIETIGFKF